MDANDIILYILICKLGNQYYVLNIKEEFTQFGTYSESVQYIKTHYIHTRKHLYQILIDAKILAQKYNVKIYYSEQYIVPRLYCDGSIN